MQGLLYLYPTGQYNKINVNRVVGKAKIAQFYNEPSGDKEIIKPVLLPQRRFKQIDMSPGRKPG